MSIGGGIRGDIGFPIERPGALGGVGGANGTRHVGGAGGVGGANGIAMGTFGIAGKTAGGQIGGGGGTTSNAQ